MEPADPTPSVTTRRLKPALALLASLSFIAGSAHAADSRLDAIKRRGELVMLTHASTTTYYESDNGPAGFEYDLARLFARHLGVRLRVVVAEPTDLVPRLLAGKADFAAGGVALAHQDNAGIRLTPPYQQARLHVVYRHGSERPRGAEALLGGDLAVPAGTVYAERLRALAAQHPDLVWRELPQRRPEELLQQVMQGRMALTLTDSNTLAANRPGYPEVLPAFSLPQLEPLAWAFRRGDAGLYRAATRFLAAQRASGTIAQLIDRYYGPGSRANFVNLAVFHQRVRARLPRFRTLFRRAGTDYGLDWRLLAAIGYQESYWNPRSISHTGVRGLMMLTRATAGEVGVSNRLDPKASIHGAARYLRGILDRLPARIQQPDRLWLALAAYNVGPSHLEDARILTQKRGGDPDRWSDVREHLPLLADPDWYPKTRYGYARGHEPVKFVDRVRVFFGALRKLEHGEAAPSDLPARQAPAI